MERNLMDKSETITEIAKSLAKFQSEVSDPERTKENSYLKAKYVTLDSLLQAIRPVLASSFIIAKNYRVLKPQQRS